MHYENNEKQQQQQKSVDDVSARALATTIYLYSKIGATKFTFIKKKSEFISFVAICNNSHLNLYISPPYDIFVFFALIYKAISVKYARWINHSSNLLWILAYWFIR